jgi:uncharacterized protein (UPF0210 family)
MHENSFTLLFAFRRYFSRVLIPTCCLLAIAFSFCGIARAQENAASPDNLKIRAITAFVKIDRSQMQQEVADAVKMLQQARMAFEAAGFMVTGVRIATQPFPEYTQGMTTDQAVAFFKEFDALAAKDHFGLSIGPAMPNANDSPAQADLLAQILLNTSAINGNLTVGGADGVRWTAVRAAAGVIKKLEETEHSQGNFRFAATAMVPPLTPFFPGGYHNGAGHQFALAFESAGVVAEAFKGAPDPPTARQRLTDALGKIMVKAQAEAEHFAQQSGWTYVGIDLSPAPLGNNSIGAALEELTRQPLGSIGTLTAAATVTSAIKAIPVKQTGYSGLMLPVMEDARIAQRWSEGRISMDSLLSYSSVCGTGLDTVPLPGDITEQQLSAIIGDMASLAVKWNKPLSARLFPVKGKGPGEKTELTGSLLTNATIQPFEKK